MVGEAYPKVGSESQSRSIWHKVTLDVMQPNCFVTYNFVLTSCGTPSLCGYQIIHRYGLQKQNNVKIVAGREVE